MFNFQLGWILLRLFSGAFFSSLKRLAYLSLAPLFFVIRNLTVTKGASNPIFTITYQRKQLHVFMLWIHLTVSSDVWQRQSVTRLTLRHIETLKVFICASCKPLTNTEPRKVTSRTTAPFIISVRWWVKTLSVFIPYFLSLWITFRKLEKIT